MRLLKQQVPASEVLRMINARLESVTMAYKFAVGSDNKIEAEALAETKWQLAELKMQFVDLLVEQCERAAGAHLQREG